MAVKIKRPPAKARKHTRHRPGEMNKTENAYSNFLDIRQAAGEIHEWWFEMVKVRIAYDECWLTVDFMVQLPDGTIEFHDVKGGPTTDDAAVKEKVMADKFPFRLFEARQQAAKRGGGWIMKEIGQHKTESD
jgi:hypothetical protein